MKEGNVAKVISFWENKYSASLLISRFFPPHFASSRLLFPGNLLLQWSTIYYPGGRTKWKSLTKNTQVVIQQQGYMQLGSVSEVSLLVLHLPVALHSWPHSSQSGKWPSPSEQWLITPGAQDRPGTKFCHCYTTWVKLFFPPHTPIPSDSQHLIPAWGNAYLPQDKASTLSRVTWGYFQRDRMGYSRWRTNKMSQCLSEGVCTSKQKWSKQVTVLLKLGPAQVTGPLLQIFPEVKVLHLTAFRIW